MGIRHKVAIIVRRSALVQYPQVNWSCANFRELRHGEVRRILLPRTPVNKGYLTTVMAKFAEHSCFSARSTGNIKYIVPFGKEEDTKDVLVQPKNPYF